MNIFTKLFKLFKPYKKDEKVVDIPDDTPVCMPNGSGIRWNTWDNLIGTKEDIVKYIADNITKDRKVYHIDGMSVEQQLSKLEQTKFREGRVCLFYSCVDELNPAVTCRLETIYIKLRNSPL